MVGAGLAQGTIMGRGGNGEEDITRTSASGFLVARGGNVDELDEADLDIVMMGSDEGDDAFKPLPAKADGEPEA